MRMFHFVLLAAVLGSLAGGCVSGNMKDPIVNPGIDSVTPSDNGSWWIPWWVTDGVPNNEGTVVR